MKQSANVGRERIFLIMMDLCGSTRVLEDVSVIWGLVASSGYFIKNGTIIGVEDATIIITILISIPTPIAVE